MLTQTHPIVSNHPPIQDIQGWLNSREVEATLIPHIEVYLGDLNPFTGDFKPASQEAVKKDFEYVRNSLLTQIKSGFKNHYPMEFIGRGLIVGVDVKTWGLFFVIDAQNGKIALETLEDLDVFEIDFRVADWVKKYKVNRLKFAQL